jgi:hypothetical protein
MVIWYFTQKINRKHCHPLYPHGLSWGKKEFDTFNFSKYFSYGYAESLEGLERKKVKFDFCMCYHKVFEEAFFQQF